MHVINSCVVTAGALGTLDHESHATRHVREGTHGLGEGVASVARARQSGSCVMENVYKYM